MTAPPTAPRSSSRSQGVPSLQYAVNASLPVIESTPDSSYYCVQNGVWFAAPSAFGPWAVATAVPPAIYDIPPSCPLHYVTYCRIYGVTPEAVYVGYTPGYLGAVASADGVVVFGTGYCYPPCVGLVWNPQPCTYGFDAGFECGPDTGFDFGFAGDSFAGGWPCAVLGTFRLGMAASFQLQPHQRQSRGSLRALGRQSRLDPAASRARRRGGKRAAPSAGAVQPVLRPPDGPSALALAPGISLLRTRAKSTGAPTPSRVRKFPPARPRPRTQTAGRRSARLNNVFVSATGEVYRRAPGARAGRDTGVGRALA